MNLAQLAVDNRVVTYFFVVLIFLGGLFAYTELGRLEDPDFTVKTAMVITGYPGASAEEVEQEVTGVLERAIQELTQLDNIYSISRAGLSIIRVDIKQNYWSDRLPQVWDEMRNKISDATAQLPPGTLTPDVVDDFSFVYGFVLAIQGDGFSQAQLEEYAKYLKKELSLTQGVSRAELWGMQPKVVYVDVSNTQITELGITPADVITTLTAQNMVVPAGSIDISDRRVRIKAAGEFERPEDISGLVIRRSLLDAVANVTRELIDEDLPTDRTSELITIGDIATVRMGYLEPPLAEMRFNGRPSVALSLASQAGGNVIVTGENIDKRLEELMAEMPVGIEVERFAWQSDLVTESIDAFIINLIEAVLIVLVVLALSMGWRMGWIIGAGLMLTILGTFIFMLAADIPMHRVSLGALVVALGMMVDNSIVVAEGALMRMQAGEDPKSAAIKAAARPSGALLGATLVAAAAFYPVYASPFDGGEYGRTLFLVVGVSLMLSWLLSMTVTPLQCIRLLKVSDKHDESADPYGGGMFRAVRSVLSFAIRKRVFTILSLVVLLGISIWGSTQMTIQFFPFSTRSQFMIDFWAPEGTRVQSVSEGIRIAEELLSEDERVVNFASFIGAGGPRFYLPVEPELPNSSYAQIVVNTVDYPSVNELIAELEEWSKLAFPGGMVRFRKYTVGPGDAWPFELRVVGPAEGDLKLLREIGEQGKDILRAHPLAENERTDMRERVPSVNVEYDTDRARYSVVSRLDVAQSTMRAFDGLPVGLYRDGDEMYPIMIRNVETERASALSNLDVLPVTTPLSTESVPLGQVVEGIELEWEDPIITRWNRGRQIAIQATPRGVTFATLYQDIVDEFDKIELPPGYSFYWDGEYKSMIDNVIALTPGMVPTGIVMMILCVLLFRTMRPTLIIALTIPFGIIGIVAGLLGLNIAFSFMAILGAMSLVGMMIKNSIVLLDQINFELDAGKEPYEAVIYATITRVRPIILAAATTVLGVMPLLQDVFWVSMASTIIFGLAVGTLLTILIVPLLFAIFYKIKAPASSDAG